MKKHIHRLVLASILLALAALGGACAHAPAVSGSSLDEAPAPTPTAGIGCEHLPPSLAAEHPLFEPHAVRMVLAVPEGVDAPLARDVIARRIAHAGGRVKSAEIDGSELVLTAELPGDDRAFMEALLVPGRLRVHPVADGRLADAIHHDALALGEDPEVGAEVRPDGQAEVFATERERLSAWIAEWGPSGERWALLPRPTARDTSAWTHALLLDAPAVDAEGIQRCAVGMASSPLGVTILVGLTPEARQRLTAVTTARAEERVAYVLDGEALLVPRLVEPMDTPALMLGPGADPVWAAALTAVLRGGELPERLPVVAWETL